jgi:O-antigen ligase
MLLNILLILIFTRPFISSLAFPCANAVHVTLLFGFILAWILRKHLSVDAIKPIQYPLLLLVLAIAISTVFAQDKIAAVKELYNYAQGIFLLIIAASLSPVEKKRIIACMVISAFVISLLAIYQYLFGFRYLLSFVVKKGITDTFVLDYIGRGRPFLPFVTPNTLAGYLAMMIPLYFAYKNRIWTVIPLFCALLMTKSLGALASLFLGLSIYFYLQKGPKKRNIFFLIALSIIIGLVLFARLGIPQLHTHPLFSATMRLRYWQDTLGVIKINPLTGVGPGNFNLIYSRYAHNSYLQIWAEMGISGIIAVLWLAFTVISYGLQNLKNDSYKSSIIVLICANSIFLIHNLVDFTFFLPEINLIWWVLLGVLASTLPSHSQNSKKSFENDLHIKL